MDLNSKLERISEINDEIQCLMGENSDFFYVEEDRYNEKSEERFTIEFDCGVDWPSLTKEQAHDAVAKLNDIMRIVSARDGAAREQKLMALVKELQELTGVSTSGEASAKIDPTQVDMKEAIRLEKASLSAYDAVQQVAKGR